MPGRQQEGCGLSVGRNFWGEDIGFGFSRGPLCWGQGGGVRPQRRVLSQLLAESRQPSGRKAWLVFS